MEIKDFIEKFAEAVEIDDSSVLTPETKFRDLDEWNSLAVLSLLAMLDEEYDVQIQNAQLRELNTLQDIVNFIEKQ